MEELQKSAGLLQLAPFFVFIGMFLVSTFFLTGTISPVVTCAIAIVFSFFTFQEKMSMNEKMKLFIQGSCRPAMMTMF